MSLVISCHWSNDIFLENAGIYEGIENMRQKELATSCLSLLTPIRQRQQQLCNHEGCHNEAVFDGICVTHGAMRRIYAKNGNNNGGGSVTDDSTVNNHGNESKAGAANACWSLGEGYMANERTGSGVGVGDIGQLDFLCDFEDLYDPFT